MATINLGAIKFNWKGAYNSGTTYAVDDVVSSGGNSYVCIQASQGNAVGNATAYWNIMSSAGTAGAEGGSTTLTTQGDMLYRDGSGLQRLAKGTASQELRMNSGATAPEWHTPAVASSDMVLLHTTAVMSGSIIVVDNIFNSTYDSYKVVISGWKPSADAYPEFRFRSGGASGSIENDASYHYAHYRIEQQFSGGTATGSTLTVAGAGETVAQWHQQLESGNSNKVGNTEITIHNANRANSTYWRNSAVAVDSGGGWIVNMLGGGVYYKAQVITGIQFQSSAGTTTEGVLKIYGLK